MRSLLATIFFFFIFGVTTSECYVLYGRTSSVWELCTAWQDWGRSTDTISRLGRGNLATTTTAIPRRTKGWPWPLPCSAWRNGWRKVRKYRTDNVNIVIIVLYRYGISPWLVFHVVKKRKTRSQIVYRKRSERCRPWHPAAIENDSLWILARWNSNTPSCVNGNDRPISYFRVNRRS